MIKSLCQLAAKHLPNITIAPKNIKYLSRYYFFLKDRDYFNIYLHQFHSSDLDKGVGGFGLLHSHPFRWSFSIILNGSYAEERRLSNDNVIVRLFKPGNINFISRKDFHRVDLITDEVWTIFFTGPRITKETSNWGFWDRVSKEYKDWKSFPDAIE